MSAASPSYRKREPVARLVLAPGERALAADLATLNTTGVERRVEHRLGGLVLPAIPAPARAKGGAGWRGPEHAARGGKYVVRT